MRLRLAPVECKICTTEGCESKYEGMHCPKCQQAFRPESTVKSLQDRLILVDVDPPFYEQTQRCRCTECKNLFDLSERDVIARAQCVVCNKPIFERTQLQKIWQDTETLLQRARKLDRALRQVLTCPQCAQPVNALSWCPLHGPSAAPSTTGGLPQNMTVVWVRTFHTTESLEELQQREWLENESMLAREQERENETDDA